MHSSTHSPYRQACLRVSARRGGFTLIELLIVVAIIAILAAIAVPNFLEAQVRSKVSRVLADVRSLKTGIESYAVDFNDYPETDTGWENPLMGAGVGLIRITTPIAFMTSIPRSPFDETQLGHPPSAPQNAVKYGHILWVRAEASPNITTITSAGLDQNYINDRYAYLVGTSSPSIGAAQFAARGTYMMKSVGPDNIDDRNGLSPDVTNPLDARVYDPTNGTLSRGDIVAFQDTELPAKQR